MYLLSRYASFDPPPEVALALGSLIGGLVYFITGYFTPPASRDVPLPPTPKGPTP